MAIPNDDEIYAQIARELAVDYRDEALWTRAFMEQNGDPARTKARYIRLRRAAIIREAKTEQERLEALAQQKEQEAKEQAWNDFWSTAFSLPFPLAVGFVVFAGLAKLYAAVAFVGLLATAFIAIILIPAVPSSHYTFGDSSLAFTWQALKLLLRLLGLVLGTTVAATVVAAIPYAFYLGLRWLLCLLTKRFLVAGCSTTDSAKGTSD